MICWHRKCWGWQYAESSALTAGWLFMEHTSSPNTLQSIHFTTLFSVSTYMVRMVNSSCFLCSNFSVHVTFIWRKSWRKHSWNNIYMHNFWSCCKGAVRNSLDQFYQFQMHQTIWQQQQILLLNSRKNVVTQHQSWAKQVEGTSFKLIQYNVKCLSTQVNFKCI